MAKFPYFPFYPADHLADVRHLTPEEHSAHWLLICEAWRRPECSLPDDDELLARLAGLSMEAWRRAKPAVTGLWQSRGRGQRRVWTQKRLAKEHERAAEKSRAQSDKAASRWNNKKKANAAAMPLHCNGNANHNHNHNQIYKGGGGGAPACEGGEDEGRHKAILAAAGFELTRKWLGSEARRRVAEWRGLGLSHEEILTILHEVRTTATDPPASLRYFDRAMQRAAGRKAEPPLNPIGPTRPKEGSPRDRHDQSRLRDERIAHAARRRG